MEGSDNLCEHQSWPGDQILDNGILQVIGKRKEIKGETFYYRTYTVKDYDYDIMFIFSDAGNPQTVNLGPFAHDVYLELDEKQADGKYTAKDVTEIYGNDAVEDLTSNSPVLSVRYIDLAGHTATTPFDGINIVVKRHADGSLSTTKIIY